MAEELLMYLCRTCLTSNDFGDQPFSLHFSEGLGCRVVQDPALYAHETNDNDRLDNSREGGTAFLLHARRLDSHESSDAARARTAGL